MVACVMEHGWTVEATAEGFQVHAKTVRKWRDRFVTEGPAGLLDRSSRPHSSPNQTRPAVLRRVVALRRRHRWGAAHIGHDLGVAPSTVQAILHREGLGSLDCGDRPRPASRPPVSARAARRARACRRQEDLRYPERGRLAHPRPRPSTHPEALHDRLPVHPHRARRLQPTDLLRNPQRPANRHRPPASGDALTPGSPPTASPSNECSPTTAPATGHACGAPRSPTPA